MNTKKYIYLTIYIILGFLINTLAPPILSYSHTDYSFYYLVFRIIYFLFIFLTFISSLGFGIYELIRSKERRWKNLLVNIVIICLPVLAIILCNKIDNALSQDGLPWH
jgi:hypothetical protein